MSGKVFKTDDPDALTLWDELRGPAQKRFRAVLAEIESETGRQVYTNSNQVVVGLSRTAEEARQKSAPSGWKWGNGDRYSGFIEPRARGGDAARALLKRANDVSPRIRKRFHDEYGVPELEFVGSRLLTPGIYKMGGYLWVFFSTEHEVSWHGGKYAPHERQTTLEERQLPGVFTPTTLADYFTAKEAHDAAHPQTKSED